MMTTNNLDTHINTINSHSKETFASTLDNLINIIYIIKVGLKALLVSQNRI